MNALEKALNVKFQSTSSLTSVFTGNTKAASSGTNTMGLHWDRAPEGAAVPLLIAQVMSTPVTSKFGGVAFGDITVQFRGIANSRNTAIGYMETLIGVYDDFRPTLD